ncbi:MAG: hypothetical protein CMF67_02100 [Magnetovibrio sp.]|nr:hypothetical protein [Magnetovibrio sp.]
MEAEVNSKVPALASLICRGVAVRDISDIFRLCHQLGYELRQIGFGDKIAHIIERPGDAIFVVADTEDTAVGFIHVYIGHAVEIKACAQIQALVVACSARRQGAAKLLVGAAEEWARAEGLQWLQWLSLYCSSYRVLPMTSMGHKALTP